MWTFLLFACNPTTEPPTESATVPTEPSPPPSTVCAEDDTSPCCAAPEASAKLCVDLPLGTGEGVGSFVATADGWQFTADGQDPWEIYSYVRGGAALPDLAALGTVTVQAEGGCAWDGEDSPLGGAFWIEAAGELAVVVGTGPVDDPRLSVQFEPSSSCPERAGDGCTTALRSRALVFERDGLSATLLPGEHADLGSLRVYALRGSENVGTSTCDDVAGGAFNWVVTAL